MQFYVQCERIICMYVDLQFVHCTCTKYNSSDHNEDHNWSNVLVNHFQLIQLKVFQFVLKSIHSRRFYLQYTEFGLKMLRQLFKVAYYHGLSMFQSLWPINLNLLAIYSLSGNVVLVLVLYFSDLWFRHN